MAIPPHAARPDHDLRVVRHELAHLGPDSWPILPRVPNHRGLCDANRPGTRELDLQGCADFSLQTCLVLTTRGFWS
jgi:hypothetical protein